MPSPVIESRFELHLSALRSFVAREKHCSVPYSHVEGGVQLGRWVSYIRARRRKDVKGWTSIGGITVLDRPRRVPEHHVQALEAIPGWTWEARRGPAPKTERNAEIRELYMSGATLGILAETYGLSKQRIHQICSEMS